LKAAGISDTEEDKQKAGGHKTLSMVAVYERKLPEVKPAGVTEFWTESKNQN
jgi:hypothetical protein